MDLSQLSISIRLNVAERLFEPTVSSQRTILCPSINSINANMDDNAIFGISVRPCRVFAGKLRIVRRVLGQLTISIFNNVVNPQYMR